MNPDKILDPLTSDETKELLKACFEQLSEEDCIEIVGEWLAETGIIPDVYKL